MNISNEMSLLVSACLKTFRLPTQGSLYFVFPCSQLSYSSGNLQCFYTAHRKWDLFWGEVSKQQNDHTYSLRTGDTGIVPFISICISTDRKWRQTRIVLVVAISRKKSPSAYVLKAKLGNKERASFVCIFCIKCAKQRRCEDVMFVRPQVTCPRLFSRLRKDKYKLKIVRWIWFWPYWSNIVPVLNKDESKFTKFLKRKTSVLWKYRCA